MKIVDRAQGAAPLRDRTSQGFTVLEMIGVLSIMVLLGSLVTESVLRRVKISARQAETASLRAMGEAFRAASLRTRTVPVVTNAMTLIGAELAMAPGMVTTNFQRQGRTFLYDPNLGFGSSGGIPYTQGVRGAREVNNLRVLIVSSLTDPLPSLAGTNNFNTLWGTAPEAIPAGWTSAWTGEAGDLVIERVDLRPQFCRLHLNNLDRVLTAAYGIVSTNTQATLGASSTTNGWYFIGTPLLLFDSAGILQVIEVLNEDASYVYEDGRWGRYLVSGVTKPVGGFGALVDQFLNTPRPPQDPNQFGANQQAIVDEMYYYMWSYANWASAGFPKGGSSTATHVPELRFIEDSSVRLTQVSNNILKN